MMEEESQEEPKEKRESEELNLVIEDNNIVVSKEDQIKELEDKLLRSSAEIENIRKRSEKERSEAYKIGISIFVKDFVPVLDNMQRTLESIKTSEEINYDSFVGGIRGNTVETSLEVTLSPHNKYVVYIEIDWYNN